MKTNRIPRRDFLRTTALLGGTALLSPWSLAHAHGAAPAAKRTAADQVTLGKTGLRLSRLGFGTGVQGGHPQVALGKEGFVRLIRHAYDQGITYLDTAQEYATFKWIGDAIRDLPREKLFIQSKIPGRPDDVLAAIDAHRKAFRTDYLDSLLMHRMVREKWTDEWKRVMDAFDEAKEKKWIRAKGISSHSLPALRAAAVSRWTEVALVRVNPQGRFTDGETDDWDWRTAHDIAPVLRETQALHARGAGVIGMKLIGNGTFRQPEEREKSIRFTMARPDIDAVVIGFTAVGEIDEAIERINRSLAG